MVKDNTPADSKISDINQIPKARKIIYIFSAIIMLLSLSETRGL